MVGIHPKDIYQMRLLVIREWIDLHWDMNLSWNQNQGIENISSQLNFLQLWTLPHFMPKMHEKSSPRFSLWQVPCASWKKWIMIILKARVKTKDKRAMIYFVKGHQLRLVGKGRKTEFTGSTPFQVCMEYWRSTRWTTVFTFPMMTWDK